MARQFQFVAVSNPNQSRSSESRKSTHSHIMRHVHAKKRRLQMQRFQDESTNCGTKQNLRIFRPFLPSPMHQVLTNTKDPFSSLARPLLSEEYFLLDHYLQVVLPFSIGHCGLFDYHGDHQAQMLREWVGLAITDDAFMAAGVLLSTCRYILRDQPDHPIFTRMVLQYKRIGLRTLRGEISSRSKPITATTVAKALALAIDEVNSGEYRIARQHLQGVFAIIQFGGGPQLFGLTGLLERMYDSFIAWLRLTDIETDSGCCKA